MTSQYAGLGTVLLTREARRGAEFFRDHFGFEMVAELAWYWSLLHPSLPQQFLDFIDPDHPESTSTMRGNSASGVMIALLAEDALAEAERLKAAGLRLLKEPADEPWGQRRFQVAAPGGVVVEVVQRIPPDQRWLDGLAR